MYYTYVLYSETFNKIYVGYSANPKHRLKVHNSNENKGWTKSFQPWKIIHIEEFATQGEALKREKQLKTSRGRDFIWNLLK